MLSKYTEWYHPNIKPIREGVYETIFRTFRSCWGYSYWSGKSWSNQRDCPMAAYDERNSVDWVDIGAVQAKAWRGLVSEPTAPVRRAQRPSELRGCTLGSQPRR
jgi:hypothetical protein